MYKLLAWEYAELQEFLPEEGWELNAGTWYRFNEDNDPLMGIRVYDPPTPGPFRFYTLQAIPVGTWSPDQCNEYLRNLVRYYTGYHQRVLVQSTLVDELQLDSGKAFGAAVLIAKIYNEGEIQVVAPPEQLPLEEREVPIPKQLNPLERLVRFVEGGWLKLSWAGELFQVQISIRDANKQGYGRALKGFVRAPSRDQLTNAALIFGWNDDIRRKTPEDSGGIDETGGPAGTAGDSSEYSGA